VERLGWRAGTRTPPDELLARIEGERDGELRGIDFPLRRVACPGAIPG
jgi:hypothetical protein